MNAVVIMLTDSQLAAEIRAASGEYLDRLLAEARRRGLR
jgi:hypothetical protein